METLYEHLEELCESYGAEGWEVEYSVSLTASSTAAQKDLEDV
jgi:hypothetical protein